MKKCILSLIIFSIITATNAQNNPISLASDARIKKVFYQENNVIPIHGMTFTTTQIQFGNNEKILDIEGGDSAAWMVTYHQELPNMLFIKPTIFDSDTNMTVITNQHSYYFHLTSNRKLEPNPSQNTYALKFDYQPIIKHIKTTAPKHKATKTKKLNTDYRFSGCPQLVPLHVFDDGQFTYFELSTNGAVPAIFAVDDKSGKESTVNTRRFGKYIVVQRIAPQFTLRQGAYTTSVFNTTEINRIAQNRRPQ